MINYKKVPWDSRAHFIVHDTIFLFSSLYFFIIFDKLILVFESRFGGTSGTGPFDPNHRINIDFLIFKIGVKWTCPRCPLTEKERVCNRYLE